MKYFEKEENRQGLKAAITTSMVAASVVITESAHAYLPDVTTVIQPIFDEIETDFASVMPMVWATSFVLIGGVIAFNITKSLVKRGTSL